jgi:hypothetical protein
MNPVSLNLPLGADVANYLYQELQVEDLTQDMLTVRLQNGYFIDVGWYPEHDPKGRFLVRVFEGTWNRQRLENPIETRNISEVVFITEMLADHFSRTHLPISHTGECRITVPAITVPG